MGHQNSLWVNIMRTACNVTTTCNVAWNNLPSEVKNSETVNIFKAKLKIIN